MGRRGPPPKPSAIKLLDGNPGHQVINIREPKPQKGIPDCPAHLDHAAKKEWERITPLLYELNLLTRIDGSALAAYCQLYSRWAKAETALKGKRLTMPSPNGEIVRPEVKIADRAMAQMRQFLAEFGLTPASRSRVAALPSLPGEHGKVKKDKTRFFGSARAQA